MATAAQGVKAVAKKKGESGSKPRYGTLVRVSDEFAEALRRAASFEGMSMAEFATAYLLPAVDKRYRDAVFKEAKRMEDKGAKG